MYQKLNGNIEGPLEKIIKTFLRKETNGKDDQQPKAWEILFNSKDTQKIF